MIHGNYQLQRKYQKMSMMSTGEQSKSISQVIFNDNFDDDCADEGSIQVTKQREMDNDSTVFSVSQALNVKKRNSELFN